MVDVGEVGNCSVDLIAPLWREPGLLRGAFRHTPFLCIQEKFQSGDFFSSWGLFIILHSGCPQSQLTL